MRTMAFTARKPSFVATCNGSASWIQGLLAKVQAYAAPIKSKVAQVYAEHGFSLDSTATTAGTADDTCTITLTTKKLGKDFTDAAQTITFTGDFTVNPVKWTAAPSAGITGNAASLSGDWK